MAGRIPQSFIDDILQRVDIVEVIDSRVPLKKAGREYKACCPFHGEKTPSFTVSPQKQFYHCFGCGAHGSAIGFLMDHGNLSFVESVEEIASQLSIEVPYEQNTQYSNKRPSLTNSGKDIYQVLELANKYYRYQLANHESSAQSIDYLKKRGVDGVIAKRFELGFAPDEWSGCLNALGKTQSDVKVLGQAGLIIERPNKDGFYDRFRGRIIFPIKDTRNRTIAFGGRIIDQGEPKYLNSPETPVYHKGNELYGLNLAADAIKKMDCVYVVEGYMDVIMLAKYGIENAVATLGTAMTVRHVERLFKFTDEIVCCFDGDKAGERAAWRALENVVASIKGKRNIRFLFLPNGEDPDSMVSKEGKDAFIKRAEGSLSFSDMLLSRVKKVTNADMGTRLSVVSEIMPYIEKISDGHIKDALKQSLGQYGGSDILHQMQSKLLSSGTINKSPFKKYNQNKFSQQGYPAQNSNQNPSPPQPVVKASVVNNYNRGQQESSISLDTVSQSAYYMTSSRAVQLLLQYPQFYTEIDTTFVESLLVLKDDCVNLLIDIHRQIRLNSKEKVVNTGIILERYRAHPFRALLEILASQSYLLDDEEQLAKEYVQLMYALLYQSVDKEISELMSVEMSTGSDDYIKEQRKKLVKKRNEIKQSWLS